MNMPDKPNKYTTKKALIESISMGKFSKNKTKIKSFEKNFIHVI